MASLLVSSSTTSLSSSALLSSKETSAVAVAPSLSLSTSPSPCLTKTTTNTNTPVVTPFYHTITTIVWPGLGLLGESYILFSIGTLHPLWVSIIRYSSAIAAASDEANEDDDDVSENTETGRVLPVLLTLLSQLPYLTCASIMFGMILFGIYTNQYGRRYGSIATASFMFTGCALMTFIAIPNLLHTLLYPSSSSSSSSSSFVVVAMWYTFVVGMLVFAFGVGGEYPVAAASATERSMSLHSSNSQSHSPSHKSGRHIQLIFTMQGVGILLQVILLTTLLYILRWHIFRTVTLRDGNDNDDIPNDQYTSALVQGYAVIWLIIYSIGTLILFVVFMTRLFLLQESTIWKQQQQQQVQGHQHKDINKSKNSSTTNHPTTSSRNDTMQPTSSLSLAAMKPVSIMTPIASDTNKESSLYIPSLHAVANLDAYTNTGHRTNSEKNNTNHFISNDDRSSNDRTQNYNGSATASPDHCRTQPTLDHEAYQRVTTAELHWTVLVKILLFHSQYGLRLLSVSLSWFLWDVAFYGNKLFQCTFLFALTNRNDSTGTRTLANNEMDDDDVSQYGSIESMLQISMAATINASIALCGYYAAANIIDQPSFGRQKLQLYGFIMTGLLFIGVGYLYDTISTNWLIVLYFGTSFFGQCGPNATTFILPSEVFPTQLRTICHGVAAASGKLGALIATIVFHQISKDVDLFLLSGYTSFFAAAITYWFIPETLGHDLKENDKHWEHVIATYMDRSSREHICNANDNQNLSYLSVYERRKVLRIRSNLNNSDTHPHEFAYRQYLQWT